MSEVMTQAIIGMPYEMAMADELSSRQFHDRAQGLLADYAALESECARLKNSLLAVMARHFAEGWKKRTSDAELEQYLSAGIAQLEAKRDKLAGLLDRVITEVGRTITSELRDDIDAALAEVER